MKFEYRTIAVETEGPMADLLNRNVEDDLNAAAAEGFYFKTHIGNLIIMERSSTEAIAARIATQIVADMASVSLRST